MKKLLAAYVVVTYAMQICSVAALIAAFNGRSPLSKAFLIATAVLFAIDCVLGFSNIVVGLLQLGVPKQPVFGAVMVAKLCLIPFFIVNFVLCLLLVAGFLNPFLAWSLVLVVPLMIGLTYAALLVTSSYAICYTVRQLRTGQRTLGERLIYIVALLLFAVDNVAAVLLYVRERKHIALPPPADIQPE